jgi:dTDP-4-dehydrorhamnose 3,5-epimerase
LKITPLEIKGAFIVENEFLNDSRGKFRELMKISDFKNFKNFKNWEQNNLSISKKNAIRGIHFSNGNNLQHKLVTCVSGSIRDFVIDIRTGSPTFGKFCEVKLNSEYGNSIFIESGLGHAFLSETDNSIVSYLLTSEYDPVTEFAINPFDPNINIGWDVLTSFVSEKDINAPNLIELRDSNKLPYYFIT